MARPAVIDAPIDCSGAGRGEERAPAALRAAGLVERLHARDAGEADARIRDTRRDPDTGVIAAVEVRRAAMAIASRVREVLLDPAAVVLLGHRPAGLHPDVARENAHPRRRSARIALREQVGPRAGTLVGTAVTRAPEDSGRPAHQWRASTARTGTSAATSVLCFNRRSRFATGSRSGEG